MKRGQTSAVHFLSKVGSSVISFVALVYFSQRLGADIIGRYFLVLALVGWLIVVGGTSVSLAVTKRMTEEPEEAGRFLAAGALIQAAFVTAISLLLFAFRPYVVGYLGFSLLPLVVALFAANAAFLLVGGVLSGREKVHVWALLDPLNTTIQRAFQLGAVLMGAGLTGLLAGHAGGFAVTAVAGTRLYQVPLAWPERRHVGRLLEYVRYIWVSNTETRVFSTADLLVLGLFVSTGFIGAYGIAWNIASLLAIFGYSLSATVFPEISRRSSGPSTEDVGELVSDALAYTGLFLLPGLVGAQLLGTRILSIYGEGFVQGMAVLGLLVLARLVYGYHGQLINAINAVDRADLAFRLNLVFIVANLSLNLLLVWLLGGVGAAIASLISATLVLGLSFVAGRRLIPFELPIREVGSQIVAAVAMGAVVWFLDGLYDIEGSLPLVVVDVVVLVGLGAAFYFAVLYGISPAFREKVIENIPLADRYLA